MSDVVTARDGAVLTITLNRPEVLNALSGPLQLQLRDALDEAAAPEIRSVVLTGSGKAFCAGQDLRDFEELSGTVAEALEELYHPNVRRIRALRKPVICALNGVAAGAGLSLAMACDLRVAAESASLVPGFVGIGLVPDAGGTWFLARELGFARAFEWLGSNRRLPASEALTWGLVGGVIPDAEFMARVAELATEWAARPTTAIGATKALLEEATAGALEAQLAREASAQAAMIATHDFAEGVAAFLAKRPAVYKGA
ncbi:MAG: enoyl-CoA hydratase-related protein [Gaiellales bacterium]